MTDTHRFVLLPTRGFTADQPHNSSATETFLVTLQGMGVQTFEVAVPEAPSSERPGYLVLDSIHSNGAKLVEMSDAVLMWLKRAQPGLRVVREVFYPPARAPRPDIQTGARMFSSRAVLASNTVTVVFKGTGKPVPGVDLIAFSDYEARKGAKATTDANGEATLEFPSSIHLLERVYVYPAHSAWPVLLKNWSLKKGVIELPAVDVAFKDSRAKAYPLRQADDGRGVTVGVIDTGIGPHHALNVSGGANTVTGEDPNDWSDSDVHGTHVAGIVAGQGQGFSGVASGVDLRAYRVFGKDSDGASSFAIAKAIDRAVADGCDLLNLSLGGGPEDATTSEAIKAARAQGVVCVIAAGNDGGPVAWPGKHPLALAVSAMGFKGQWPAGAMQSETVMPPLGRDASFIARFSNTGPEIDVTGPGVGIISCIPGDHFGVMDGTSMACPAVTGALARRLALDARVLGMPRDADRADAIVKLALSAASDLGLPPLRQGAGLAL
jgi:subtilisin